MRGGIAAAGRRRTLALVFAIGAVITTTAAIWTAPANAAATTAPPAVPAHAALAAGAPASEAPTFTGTSAVSGPPDITCRIDVRNPAVGTASDGTRQIFSYGATVCSYPVSQISQHHNLYSGGAQVGWDNATTVGIWIATTEPWYPCWAGVYSAEAWATIYAPPGYWPPSATIHDASAPVSISAASCGGGGGGGGGGEPICGPFPCLATASKPN